MTALTTLTDRYVWAVIRLLPERQRAEIGRELRASIRDMVEARLGDGGPDDGGPDAGGPDAGPARSVRGAGTATAAATAAERAVLAELGDPRRLAVSYADRPRYLIGPEQFGDWWRLLRQLLVIVVPIIAVLSALGRVIEGAGPAAVLGSALGGAVATAYGVAFWVTFGYAIYGWFAATGDLPTEEWTVDALPDVPPSRRVGIGDTVAGIAITLITVGAIVVQHLRPPLQEADGTGVPLLNPDLWAGWLPALLAVLVIGGAVPVLAFLQGRWTVPLAAANAVVNGALVVLVAWLALDGRVVNQRFLELLTERAGWEQVPTVSPGLIILAVAAPAAWDAVEAFWQALRRDPPVT